MFALVLDIKEQVDEVARSDRLKVVSQDERELEKSLEIDVDQSKDIGLKFIYELKNMIASGDEVGEQWEKIVETAERVIKARTHHDISAIDPWTIRPNELVKQERIGSGGSSIVHLATWTHGVRKQPGISPSSEIVAVKEYKESVSIDVGCPTLSTCRRSNELPICPQQHISDEITMWRSVKHRNILPFVGAGIFETPSFVVMPYYKNGNVLEYIRLNEDANKPLIVSLYPSLWPFSDELMACQIKDVASAINYLHKEKIIHGDIKVRSINFTFNSFICVD